MIIVLAAVTVLACVIPLLAPPGSAFRSAAAALPAIVVLTAFTVTYAIRAHPRVGDKLVYVRELGAVGAGSLGDAFHLALSTPAEPGYLVFLWTLDRLGVTGLGLFAAVAVVSMAALLAGSRLLLPVWQLPFVAFIAVGLGFIPSFASLVVRQGLSLSALFVAICLVARGARWQWAPWLALTASLHWSALPVAVVVGLFALTRRLPLRLVVGAWLVAAALFLTASQQRVLGPLVSLAPGLAEYSGGDIASAAGARTNRLDFFALSAAILIVGLLARRRPGTPPWYDRVVGLYALLNIYFLLFGFIAYSDRVGAYSWLLAPLVVGAPLASRDPAASRSVGLVLAVTAAVIALGFRIGPYALMLGLQPYS